MAGPELTPELLAQLEKDAAWWAPDPPYRLTVEGGKTIDGDYEDFNEMTVYGILDDGSSHEVATFHVDNMAPRAVRLFAAVPALVAAAKEHDQLRTRQQELLATIARLSQTVPFAEEIQGWEGQRAKMIAEVGTLRAELAQIAGTSLGAMRREAAQLRDMLTSAKADAAAQRAEVERLRDLALDAVDVIEEATTPTNKLAAALRAQIERKP